VVGAGYLGWYTRPHFFSAAARALHLILGARARRRGSLRAGGAWRSVDLEGLELASEAPAEGLLALEEALERLDADDPNKRRIVELRFFGGLSAEDAAMAMGMPLRTLEREWRYIRARLYRELSEVVGEARSEESRG
jgi:RNA polymerase sigma factor (TIGR02999 family)